MDDAVASTATASLSTLDAMQLTLLSAGLICLVSEGMAAKVGWLHAFTSETRPYPGQREAAGIIRAFLKDPLLVSGIDQGDSLQHCPFNVHYDIELA